MTVRPKGIRGTTPQGYGPYWPDRKLGEGIDYNALLSDDDDGDDARSSGDTRDKAPEVMREDGEELPENFFVAPKDVYMPDLTAVADVLLGKLVSICAVCCIATELTINGRVMGQYLSAWMHARRTRV